MVAIEQIFDDIGGFSNFQIIMIVWVYTIKFFIAWSMMLMSFGGYTPDYLCFTDNGLSQQEASSLNESALWDVTENGIDNFTLLNTCSLNGSSCDEYHFFGSKNTVISEFSLVCDLRWLKDTITSIQMVGVLFGSIIGGHSGDYFGRKGTLYGSFLLHSILCVIAAFSMNWIMFIIMRFLIGIMIGIVLVIIIPYPTEFFPLKWRHLIPAIPMWPLGVVTFAGGAWLLEDWSYLHLATAIVSLPCLFGFFYIPESTRWLATQGRLQEAHEVLEKMARVNGAQLPPSAKETLKRIAEEEKSNSKVQKYSYIDLFKSRLTARITIIVAFKWIVLSMLFYGLSFAVSSFSGDLYLNMFLMSIVELPAYFISLMLIDRIGRRWTCVIFFIIAVVGSYACIVVELLDIDESDADQIISIMCLTAKLAVAACWSASQTWVTESYPTVTRSLGYGFANTASRIGAIIAPFVIDLDENRTLTFMLMGTLSLISLIITNFIPETRNITMAETVEEAAKKSLGISDILTSQEIHVTKVSCEESDSVVQHSTSKTDIGLVSAGISNNAFTSEHDDSENGECPKRTRL